MQKRMRIMLISLAILFGLIFLYKVFVNFMMKRYLAAHQSPVILVTAMTAQKVLWQPLLVATGNTVSINGVDVTTQLAGMINGISFTGGGTVKKGDVLVQLNADTDLAQLRSIEANLELAKVTYERDKAQYAVKAISKAQLDTDVANLKSFRAQVEQQKETIAKKTIRAPFDGRLGIKLVNEGQFLNPGDAIVNLQTLDPIFVNFSLPQQNLMKLKIGQKVKVTADSFPGQVYLGEITTINPLVDPTTRNLRAQATIKNPNSELLPGMFTNVEVIVGEPQMFLTLPQTAISFNPYGELVFKIDETGKDNKKEPVLKVTQTFVTTGETRGNLVKIIRGLNEGDRVVTSGQLKLKNGSQVSISKETKEAPQSNVVNTGAP